MRSSGWKYVYASVIGTSHIKTGMPCQDTSSCTVLQPDEERSILVAVASDGAGSAKHAEIGSSLICSSFTSEMESYVASGNAIHDITHEFMQDWLTQFQNEIKLRADEEALTPRDFACTLLAAVVDHECAVFMQIGDGSIVISSYQEPDDYSCVFIPQKGEYANMTTFATDDKAAQILEFEFVEQQIYEVAIFTDGIERIALKFEGEDVSAHAPFFLPMFSPLRKGDKGHLEALTTSLETFLNSPRINERTDDDKTLILATRRYVSPQEVKQDSHESPEDSTSL